MIFVMPMDAEARVGLQPGFENIHIDPEPEPEPEPELTEQQQKDIIEWAKRVQQNAGFWAGAMNFRKVESSFRKAHENRRQKRREKRLQCRTDIRKANRDAILRETLHCYRATLSQDLEILRKQKQFVEALPGVREEYRGGAVFHIGNLMDAISTIITAIDAGVYGSKESLQDAKVNLGAVFRSHKRLAMTRLRVDRSKAWMNHLMIRLHEVQTDLPPPEEVDAKLQEAIDCLKDQEEVREELLAMEDNEALIEAFRQAQSDAKICIEMARSAHELNTELLQMKNEE